MTDLTGVEIRACVFDAYGTLFDFNSAVMKCRDAVGPQAQTLSEIWRRKQLEYTWLRSLMGRYTDFWHVTGESLDYALAVLGKNDPALRALLMQQYLTLDAYPEVPSMLKALKAVRMKSAVLSNGSPTMLTGAINNSGIGPLLDAVMSADSVQIYKPHPSVYQLMIDQLGTSKDKICFMSSNAWDAVGAAAFGVHVVWVNRFGQPRENLPAVPDAEIKTLAELPALLGVAA